MLAAYPEAIPSLARTRDFNKALTRIGETFNDLPLLAEKLRHERIEDLPTEEGSWRLYYRKGSDFIHRSTLGLYEGEAGLTVALLRYSTQPYSIDTVKADLELFTKKHVERPTTGQFIYQLTGDFRIVPIFSLGCLGFTIIDKLTFQSTQGITNNGSFVGTFAGMLVFYGYITISERFTKARVANLDQYFTGKHARVVLQSELT